MRHFDLAPIASPILVDESPYGQIPADAVSSYVPPPMQSGIAPIAPRSGGSIHQAFQAGVNAAAGEFGARAGAVVAEVVGQARGAVQEAWSRAQIEAELKQMSESQSRVL